MKNKFLKTFLLSAMVSTGISLPGYSQSIIDPCGGAIPAPDEGAGRAASCAKTSTAFSTKYGRYDFHIPNFATPIKTIQININVFQRDDGSANWQNNATDIATLNQQIQWLNDFYASNDSPTDPLPGVPFISDTKIRFEVVGIYFYQNTALSNSADLTQCLNHIKSIDPARINQLNICLTNGYYLGAAGYAYLPSSTNFDYDQGVISFGSYGGGGSLSFAFSSHLAHELGHCLDLLHTYGGSCCPETCDQNSTEYISDVFGTGATAICLQQAGWSCDANAAGNTCTNNMMGGTSGAGYFSPKQMGKMHRALSIKSVRRYVKCAYNGNAIYITSNETWDFNIKLYNDLVVNPGVTLTMQCTTLMSQQARVAITKGAKLEIDGGAITAGCNDKMWVGIEVRGDRTKTQTSANQGYLIMKNGALIENAVTGVSLAASWDNWNYNGGVIQANNSTFKNNRKCVAFMSYHAPTGPDVNASYFNRCNFICDAPLRDPGYIDSYGRRLGTNYFVSLWDVKGVNFRGCTFESSTNFDVDIRGAGIYSEGASYNITSSGSANSTNVVKSQFKNLTQGIYPIDLVGAVDKNVKITYSIFDNVQQAIIGNIGFSDISSNTFSTPGFTGNPSNLKQWSIYMDGAKGFNIKHNTFNGVSTNQSYGVIVRGSEAFGGKVAYNNFTGFNWATQTEQNNQALQISCNDYTSNVKSWSLNPQSVNGILANQGTGCLASQTRAGNDFFDACNSTGRHIHSYLNTSFTYYASGSPSTSVPTCRVGNMNLQNCNAALDPTSCNEEPPCTSPPCAKKLEEQLKVERRNPIREKELLSELIRFYLEIDDKDQIIRILTELNTEDAKKLLIPTYIVRKELPKANSLLAEIPSNNEENIRYKEYYRLVSDLYSNNKTLYDINATQETKIREIAGSSASVSKNALLVLEAVKGERINREPEIEQLGAERIGSEGLEGSFDFETGGSFIRTNEPKLNDNYPNPFNGTTVISAYLPEGVNNSRLIITNLLGETVQAYSLNSGYNTIEVKNEDLKSGIYFYSLFINDKAVDTKKMIRLQ